MDPIVGGGIAAGANIVTGIMNAQTSAQNTQAQIANQQQMMQSTQNYNAAEAQKAREFNASQSQISRDYETEMSNSAYQRSRADMIKAGLNPILAAGAGGSSTPGGAQASGPSASTSTPSAPTPQNTNPLAMLGKAAESAMTSAVQARQIDLLAQEVASKRSEEQKTKAETTYVQGPQTAESQARTKESGARTAYISGPQTAETQEKTRLAEAHGNLAHSQELVNQNVASQMGLTMSEYHNRKDAAEYIRQMPDWLKRIMVQGSWTAQKGTDITNFLGSATSAAFPWANKFMRGAAPYSKFEQSDRTMRPGGQRDTSETWWQ